MKYECEHHRLTRVLYDKAVAELDDLHNLRVHPDGDVDFARMERDLEAELRWTLEAMADYGDIPGVEA